MRDSNHHITVNGPHGAEDMSVAEYFEKKYNVSSSLENVYISQNQRKLRYAKLPLILEKKGNCESFHLLEVRSPFKHGKQMKEWHRC